MHRISASHYCIALLHCITASHHCIASCISQLHHCVSLTNPIALPIAAQYHPLPQGGSLPHIHGSHSTATLLHTTAPHHYVSWLHGIIATECDTHRRTHLMHNCSELRPCIASLSTTTSLHQLTASVHRTHEPHHCIASLDAITALNDGMSNCIASVHCTTACPRCMSPLHNCMSPLHNCMSSLYVTTAQLHGISACHHSMSPLHRSTK